VEGFTLGDDDLVLLSFEAGEGLREASGRLALLTAAERAVMILALDGNSDLAIAHARGRSLRTVQVQLTAIYRKLGVSGRRELRATLGAGATPHAPG
jgi:DNA-binding CsgD family transcriptional regulator